MLLSAWREFVQPYNHATQASDFPASSRLCVFVGAKSSSSASTFTLGAFGAASLLVSHSATNDPRLVCTPVRRAAHRPPSHSWVVQCTGVTCACVLPTRTGARGGTRRRVYRSASRLTTLLPRAQLTPAQVYLNDGVAATLLIGTAVQYGCLLRSHANRFACRLRAQAVLALRENKWWLARWHDD